MPCGSVTRKYIVNLGGDSDPGVASAYLSAARVQKLNICQDQQSPIINVLRWNRQLVWRTKYHSVWKKKVRCQKEIPRQNRLKKRRLSLVNILDEAMCTS